MPEPIPSEYRGWWRIIDTAQWVNDGLDTLGPALFSLTGNRGRLRLHCLLAEVAWTPTKTGVSFTWSGAWEFDRVSGTGRVTLGQDGRLNGTLRIRKGDSSAFTAVRSEPPSVPIPSPPRYPNKWGRRW